MARIRTIKPEFFTSPDTAKISHTGRLVYISMWTLADDYGRGELNMLQIRASAFPEHDPWLDEVLNQIMEEAAKNLGKEVQSKSNAFQILVEEVLTAYEVTVYTNKGRTYYSIPSWDTHQKTQRKSKPKIPTPDDPESTPNQPKHHTPKTAKEKQGTSETTQGSSEHLQGSSALGTEEKEREREVGETLQPSYRSKKSYPQPVDNPPPFQ